VFVIPYEEDFSLVGTTDEDFQGNPLDAAISQEETDYLVDVVNTYFKTKITTDNIVHSYSGVRPLLEEKNASAQELTRDYKVELKGEAGEPVLLNIFGGKITTYRKLAEHAVDKLVSCFPRAKKAWTKEVPLPGGAFSDKASLKSELQSSYPWLSASVIERYVRQYGLLCHKFLTGVSNVDGLGQDFGAKLYQAEVDYLISFEWAQTVEDVLWRRTKHGLRLSDAQKQVLSHYIEGKVTSLQQRSEMREIA
ncbi:MAG: glycerol-3-phosphate dehydrogenase C-terminal domain-containing protein, partial [Pseudomonadota bacterium]|nr:glycerol-3-phosphate dehydrogenase C-terminal domain-containing protein [Pseudomonadota bacterium]